MKIKKVNPVAKHSRNMSGAGAHKSKKTIKDKRSTERKKSWDITQKSQLLINWIG